MTPAAQRHLGDPHVLPHEHATDLLRRPDSVQPARDRPLGAQLPVPRLLRLVGRRAPACVRAQEPAVRRVRVERADQQLPAARPRGAGLPEEARRHADDRDGLLRRGDRGDLPGARLQPDHAVRRAATPSRLQDRHHPAGQRGRCPVGAQRARHRELVDRAAHLSVAHGLGTDLVVQTPYGDSGKTTFFIKSKADFDKSPRTSSASSSR